MKLDLKQVLSKASYANFSFRAKITHLDNGEVEFTLMPNIDVEALKGEARQLVEQDKKVEAIKLVRAELGLRLMDAKKFVDEL